MTTPAEVHIGDVGTEYKAETQDDGVAFDPTLATIQRIVWKSPDGTLITRDQSSGVTVVDNGLTGANQKWYLRYVVVAADIVAGLHKVSGHYRWQGYIEFASGDHWHSSINEFFIASNL